MSIETMTKLATTTVGAGGSSSVIFSSIPQGYTDLRVVASLRSSTNSSPSVYFQLNNDSSSLYSMRRLQGTGTSTATSSLGPTTFFRLDSGACGTTDTANTFASVEMYIPNYSGSSFKTASFDSVTENNASGAISWLAYGIYASPAPITQVYVAVDGTLAQFSTVTLYGVKNAQRTAGNSIKATGGNIVFDGTYVYHTFSAAGSFTPTQPLTADVLVVAGGGAGGAQGGGGGAGGLLGASNQTLSPGSYTISVGAGGAAASGVPGGDGTTSSFGGPGFTALTATGGGGGGSGNSGQVINGRNGGSGGGGGVGGAASGGTGVAGPPRQGYDGGSAPGNGLFPGGGGGGAGAVGGTPANNTSPAGNGGVGSSAYTDWVKATGAGQVVSGIGYIAGGGGGGQFYSYPGDGIASQGGYGGGTSGMGQGFTATNALSASGGGGGGVGHPTLSLAGNGGSGVVIIRYKG